MNVSIRKFLLINLLLAITVTTTLTIIGNYYLDQKDIQRHLDILMSISTLTYEAMLGDDVAPERLLRAQKSLNNVHRSLITFRNKQMISSEQLEYAHQFKFQLWDDTGKLLLHSIDAPNIPLSSGKEGFSDELIEGKLWRVFTTYNPAIGITAIVGERYDTRNKLSHIIARDDIYIMLLTFPLSGFLIWIIIGRGFSSLNRIADEVSNRAPNYLDQVDTKGAPLEIKPLIDELNKLFIRLQQAFDREKRFAADAAHELRTPLAGLKTSAQVALKTQSISEREAALKNVISGVDRASHIVQQLLTLSRLTPETTHIGETTDLDLVRLAQETIAQLVPAALEKNIEIELLNVDKPSIINGNITALSILARNLIDNAIRYTPEGGLVQVSILNEDQQTILRVSDNGPGIPPELRARVFERFFRVVGNKSPGSGLGLAIVQQIAQLHQAKIKLSAPDVGTGLIVDIIFQR